MPKKSSLRNFALVMALGLILSAWVLMNVELVMFRELRIATFAFGILGVLAFGYGVLFALMRWKQPVPVLKCTEEGLEFHSSFLLNGRVNWPDIKGYELVQYGMGKRVLVTIKQPEKYIAKQMGLTAWVMKLNHKRFATPISIPASLFEGDVVATLEQVSRWRK